MNRLIKPAAIIVAAAAAFASTAAAQPTFEPRIGFRDDHSLANPTPTGSTYDLFQGTGQFNVLFGAFNAQGFTNRGMFNFVGTMTVDDPIGNATIAPRPTAALIAPYSFGNVIDQDSPTHIEFDANRGAGSVDNIPWNFGDPAPAEVYTYPPFGPGGASGAPDTYHPGFRFEVTITDLTLRNITINVTGTMQAVTGWFVTTEQEPEDGFPGFQNLLPGGFVEMPVSAQLSINLVPAPAAGATLALAGLLASRRRRVERGRHRLRS